MKSTFNNQETLKMAETIGKNKSMFGTLNNKSKVSQTMSKQKVMENYVEVKNK